MKRVALVAILCLPTAALAGDKPIVHLGSEEPKRDDLDEPIGPLLVRELVRQSVLLAAREELGLGTRDQSLREELEAGHLDVTLSVDAKDAIAFRLRRGAKTLFKHDIPFTGKSAGYDRLVTKLEALTRDELPGALKTAGFAGARIARAKEKAPLPKEITDGLERFTLWDQYAAVRALHALGAARGDSPERLAGLARGYANLGVLSERQWSVAHKVFKARALLYAERLVALAEPESGFAMGHRAYARALAGLHAHVLPELDRATEVSPLPGWARLIRAYVQGERPLLEDGESARKMPALSKLLAFLLVEDSRGQALAARLGAAIVAAEPGCLRVQDVLATIGSVSSRDAATAAAWKVVDETLAARIEALPGRPDSVKEAAKKGLAATVAVLVKAGDPAADKLEPSWGVLGRLVEDAALLAVYRRAEHLRGARPDDLAELLRGVKAFAREHPYGALVTSVARDGAKRRSALEDLSIADASMDHDPLITASWGLDAGGALLGSTARDAARFHSDRIERDLRQLALLHDYARSGDERADTEAWRKASPDSPLSLAVALRRDQERWTRSKIDAKAEETQSPDLFEVLARRADSRSDPEWALECWERRVAISPDASALVELAAHYEKAKREDDWRAAVDRLIATDPEADRDGLMRLRLAKRLIARGRKAEGLDYVEAAAKCETRTILGYAAECFEDAGDFERAERCVQALSKRYPPYVTDWFLWCKRTGKGDADAARALAEEDVERWSESQEPSALKEAAAFWLAAGDAKRTVKVARALVEHAPRPFWSLHVAILSKSAKRREEFLDETIAQRSSAPEDEKVLIPLVRIIARCQDDGARLDASAIENLRQAAGDGNRALVDYFVGRFLEARSQPERARVFYSRCLAGRASLRAVSLHGLARDGLARLAAPAEDRKE